MKWTKYNNPAKKRRKKYTNKPSFREWLVTMGYENDYYWGNELQQTALYIMYKDYVGR